MEGELEHALPPSSELSGWWKQPGPSSISIFLLSHMNLWAAVFLLLCLELAMYTFLILPFPLSWRRELLESVSRLWRRVPRAQVVVWTVLVMLSLLFVDSLREMYAASRAISPNNQHMLPEVSSEIYAQQRNAFLCGFTVFLAHMLYRFQSMVARISELEQALVTSPKSRRPRHQEPISTATKTETTSEASPPPGLLRRHATQISE